MNIHTVSFVNFVPRVPEQPHWSYYKVTIRPEFHGTVPIFNYECPETNHSSHGTSICPVLGLVSRICPISAAACLRIGDQKLAKI